MADQQQCSLTAIEAKYNINCGGSIEKLDKETLSDLVKLSEVVLIYGIQCVLLIFSCLIF